MIYLAAGAAVAVFVVAIEVFGLVAAGTRAIETSREASRSVMDTSLTDREKEALLRSSSVSLFKDFVSISIRSVAAVGASALTVLAFGWAGVAPSETVFAWLVSAQGIVISTLGAVVAFSAWRSLASRLRSR